MKLLFWLCRPGMLYARVKYWLWEKSDPDKPWLTPAAVEFCTAALTPAMNGWEYSSGRSTAWYASRLGHLVSIEHDAHWYRTVADRLVAVGNIEYCLIPLDHPEPLGEQAAYDPIPKYVAAIASVPDDSLHFVVVDGHYRTHCIRAAIAKLAPGGLLLVDDLQIWNDARIPIPVRWEMVHESTNGIKRTGIWKKPAGGGSTGG